MELITVITGSFIGFYMAMTSFFIGVAVFGYLMKNQIEEKAKGKAQETIAESMDSMMGSMFGGVNDESA